jgi:acyl-CoA reductase-like NAD-dependent aldehyde dehydrogenase
VHVVHGDGAAARALVSETAVSAVSFTGSNAAGEQIAALCALCRKPLQAELGGNNAAVVCADADLDAAAQAIAASAFGFAGQRCTSTRRIIVEAAVREAFVPRLLARIAALVVGDALDAATQVGPLISQAHLERVAAQVEQARVARSARVLCGGTRSTGHRPGAWYLPTLIDGVEPDAPIVQQETFGPVAVLQTAQDFAHALVLCNGVAQGLVASLFSQDPARHAQFLEGAHAGVLRINPASFPVHPEAPFLGWGSSGLGPAEHGRWDIEFYSRPQAVYGQAGPPKP